MEEKMINEKESIELITAMIRSTRNRLSLGDGNIMLMWGYLTVGVTALVWLLLTITHNPAVNWLWFIIMAAGGIATPLMARKQRIEVGAVTHLERICNGVWTSIGVIALASVVSCMAFALIGGYNCWSVMLVFALAFVGFAEIVQGLVIKENSLIAGGAVGIVCGIVTLCCITAGIALNIVWFYPMFMFAFCCMMIIPGHILNYKAARQK